MKELTDAERVLSAQSAAMFQNIQDLGMTFGLSAGKVKELADKAGIDLTGSFESAASSMSNYILSTSTGAATEQQLIKAMGDLADSSGDAEARVKGLKDALDALMGGQLGVNAATRQWAEGLETLSATLAKARGNLNNNSAAGRANTAAIDAQAKALSELVVAQANNGATSAQLNATWNKGVAALRATMAQAGFTKAQIDAYTKSLGLVPDRASTIVTAAGADRSATEVARLRAQLAALQNRTVTVTTYYKTVGRPASASALSVGGARTAVASTSAYGNIYVAAGGGMLPKQAMIAKNGPTMVQWAEPGTGGEAFIPLSAGRRGRSTQILSRVADMFGYGLTPMAGGGILSAATGQITFDVAGAAGNYQSDVSGRTSLGGYSRALTTQVRIMQQWRLDLNKIAAAAGNDVALQLQNMGERGVDLVRKMASGTAAQIRQMAVTMRQLAPETQNAMSDFNRELAAGVLASQRFQQDLLTLMKRGRADLAGELAQMGVAEGGAIASQAARADAATLGRVAANLAASKVAMDPNLLKALQLAGLLQESGGKLGITGLSGQSGFSIADVYGLIERYWTQVFSKLGGAITGVAADRARIAAGKQLTGMAAGGIVTSGNTGLYYRWAEPGSGGESLIPLGSAQRARAKSLWTETGRILGVQRADAGSRSTAVVVSRDAVKLTVVPPPGVSPAQVEEMVGRRLSSAMSQLAREIHAVRGR